MVRILNAFVAITTLSFGVVHSLALTKDFSLSPHLLSSRALYLGHGGNMRYFLDTLEAAVPNPFGMAPSSLYALYHHAMTLLASSRDTNSPSPTFGLSFGHLDLTLATTDGAPIPWNTALDFAKKMLDTASRGLLGVGYDAVVVDIALDVTIKVTLRLLFDSPLQPQRET